MVTRLAMMAACPYILLASQLCVAGDPIDPDRLTQMRQSLDDYYGRIKILRIRCDETWECTDLPRVKAIREAMVRASSRGINEDEAVRQLNEKDAERSKAKHVTEITMLDSFPSIRLEAHETWTYPDGRVDDQGSIIKVAHDGKYTQIRPAHGHVSIRSDPGYNNFFVRIPSSVLGLRSLGTTGPPTSILLGNPGVTTFEGEDSVSGLKTVVVKVGPNIPREGRPKLMSDDDWVKLWLAPSANHLPVRAEYHLHARRREEARGGPAPAENVQSIELAEILPAIDKATGKEIPFPRRMSWSDPMGVTRWGIAEVTLNVPTEPQDFFPAIPVDFNVERDGVLPRTRMIPPKP